MAPKPQGRFSITAALIALAGTAVLLVLYITLGDSEHRFRRGVDPPALLREVRQLSELVTVKYSIQKVIGLEEQKFPLGSEKLLLIVQAEVLGGMDLAELTERNLQVSRGNIVLVKLPPPKILHIVLDEKETKVWDRRITWWTPWVPYNPDLERQARLAAIASVKQSALEMGILTDTRRNAEQTIRNVLAALGARSVIFEPVS